jgi:hypothetical protein
MEMEMEIEREIERAEGTEAPDLETEQRNQRSR